MIWALILDVRTQVSSLLGIVGLGDLCDLNGVVDDKVHELVEALQ
jgi:hypothetical protein